MRGNQNKNNGLNATLTLRVSQQMKNMLAEAARKRSQPGKIITASDLARMVLEGVIRSDLINDPNDPEAFNYEDGLGG